MSYSGFQPRPDVTPALLPRVIVVSDDRWMRAGLQAELRERGYDAVGARDVPEALRYGRADGDRGPVGLLLVDQSSLGDEVQHGMLPRVRARLGQPPLVLISYGNRTPAEGDWAAVLRRPISIGEIADYVASLLPDAHASAPLDE